MIISHFNYSCDRPFNPPTLTQDRTKAESVIFIPNLRVTPNESVTSFQDSSGAMPLNISRNYLDPLGPKPTLAA